MIAKRLNLWALTSLVLVAASASMSGCGRDHNSGLGSTTVRGIPNGTWANKKSDRHPLAGSWVERVCPGLHRMEFRIFDDRTLWINFYYNGANCTSPTFEHVIVLSAVPEPDGQGGWTLNADTVTDVLIVPLAAELVSGLTSEKRCGRNNWEWNQATSVYKTECFDGGSKFGFFKMGLSDGGRTLTTDVGGRSLTFKNRLD